MSKKKHIPKPTQFGPNLKLLRLLNRHTQQRLADSVGLKRSRIASYEYGSVEPNVQTLLDLCDYLQVEPEELLETPILQVDREAPTSAATVDQTISSTELSSFINFTKEVQKIASAFRTLSNLRTATNNNETQKLIDLLNILDDLVKANGDWIESVSRQADLEIEEE